MLYNNILTTKTCFAAEFKAPSPCRYKNVEFFEFKAPPPRRFAAYPSPSERGVTS